MTYWHAVGMEKRCGCLQTIALSYQIRAGGCMLTILDNLILAGRKCCQLLQAYYHWSISAWEHLFFFFVSWQLGACYPDCVMPWWVNKDGMELHTTLEDMHLQNKSVCEKEGENKSWIHWQILPQLCRNSFKFKVMHQGDILAVLCCICLQFLNSNNYISHS